MQPEASPFHVEDPWEGRPPIPLDGWAERNRFAPWFLALIVLAGCFVLFQFVIAPVALVIFVLASGTDPMELLNELTSDPTGGLAVIGKYSDQLLIANTIGQFLAIGVPALLFSRLSSSRVAAFLRFRKTDLVPIVLALVGWVVLIPVVQFLGEMNSALPWPESIRNFERQMLEPIQRILAKPGSLLPNLFMIALTPALCEELLFRGYVQRQFERSGGYAVGIALSGLLFGAYHLQPTKFLPLCALGLYFAYLVWRTGSLWPAIVGHFANNGLAVALGNYFAQHPEKDLADLETMSFPWYIVGLGILLFVGVVYILGRMAEQRLLNDPSPTTREQTRAEL